MRASTSSILAISALMACGQTHESNQPQNSLNLTNESVALTVEHRSAWRVLWVEGETDLPNRSYVNYRVTHELARTVPTNEWPATNLIASGRAAVQDGHYWAKINTLNWPPGQVQILVQFPLPPQPSTVVTRYGEFGENLEGDNVIVINGTKAIEAEYRFRHTP